MADRYVNLNKVATYVPGPQGGQVKVSPFRESLVDSTRHPDATYVVEGEFWQRYANGGQAGPLHPFPSPRAFNLQSFPAIPVYFHDGRKGDGSTLTDGAARTVVAVQPLPGKFRAAGDVITPEGKIRRRNPETGLDEEVDDIPANRNVLKPLNAVGIPPQQLQKSIIDYLEELKVETPQQFDALTDEQLLRIPGMNPLALPQLRANIRKFLATFEEKRGAADVVSEEELRAIAKRANDLAEERDTPFAYVRKGNGPKGKYVRVKSLANYADWKVLYRTDESAPSRDTVSRDKVSTSKKAKKTRR